MIEFQSQFLIFVAMSKSIPHALHYMYEVQSYANVKNTVET